MIEKSLFQPFFKSDENEVLTKTIPASRSRNERINLKQLQIVNFFLSWGVSLSLSFMVHKKAQLFIVF